MSSVRLVADVGGTNTRIALFDEDSREFRAISGFRNADHSNLDQVIASWLDTLEEPPPQRACIAAAAPPAGDQVHMTNIGWSFSRSELARQFGIKRFAWLNDFEANAHALPHLDISNLEQINAGTRPDNAALATVGPGTGLGGAVLRWVNGLPIACDGEPGHAGVSPATELELEIFRTLLPKFGNVYAELLVSGAGLVRLYQAIARIDGADPQDLSPADVSSRAIEGSDKLCVQALETFCALLGSICGDFVLSNGAYGGLYIAGGIIPRMVPFLRSSDFFNRFSAKGAMQKHLAAVPVHVITSAQPGLIGAANAPL